MAENSGEMPAESDSFRVAARPGGDSFMDEGVLEQLIEDLGDLTAVCDVVTLFLGTLPDRWLNLVTAVNTEDANATALAAHTLKSAAAIVGLSRLSELCRDVELLARADRLPEGREQVQHGQNIVAQSEDQLRKWLNNQ